MASDTAFYPEQMEQSEGAGSPFRSDEVLVQQYFDTLRRKGDLDPELNLVLAMLEDAVICYQQNLFAKSAKRQALFEEAEVWILDDSEDHLFSFRIVCETLGIDPDWLRKGLMNWKRRQRRFKDAA